MTAWLLDTGPLVAFFDRSDADHEWAKEQWAQAPVPMLTCEPVLAEAACRPGRGFREPYRQSEMSQVEAHYL